jgi:branched-subunit amino acid aminotransferase/4-amino-4-deoxychorismate lyase
MSVNGDFYQFDSGQLKVVTHAMADTLSVADSFLVQDGLTVAIDRHFERFSGSVRGIEDIDLEDFFSAVRKAIPRTGSWFPRLEYRNTQPEGSRLFLRIRTAPERTETLSLWTCSEPDSRENFKVKGPDLSLCQKFRRTANLHGADEAVLLSPDGYIADGALSSIVWVRDQTLFAPDESTNWLPSITRELVIELADQAGLQIKLVRATPKELAGAEVWSLSALQGIRAAVSWQGVDLAKPKLALPFRKRLGMLQAPLGGF